MKNIMEWVGAAALGLILAMVLRLFVVEGYQISGESMEPTFQHGDFVFAEKITPKFSTLSIGDIVILETSEAKESTENKIIKRVVGVEGDKVEIKEGFLYRNDVLVNEGYIQEEIFGDFPPITVPKGEVFVLGDNRNNSSDSRVFGTFSYDQIKGKVAVEFFNNPLRFY